MEARSHFLYESDETNQKKKKNVACRWPVRMTWVRFHVKERLPGFKVQQNQSRPPAGVSLPLPSQWKVFKSPFVHVCIWKRAQLASSKSKVPNMESCHLAASFTPRRRPPAFTYSLHRQSSTFWVDFVFLRKCHMLTATRHCVFTGLSRIALWAWDTLFPLARRQRGGGQVWYSGTLLPADPRVIGCETRWAASGAERAAEPPTVLGLPSSGSRGNSATEWRSPFCLVYLNLIWHDALTIQLYDMMQFWYLGFGRRFKNNTWKKKKF